MLDFLGGRAQEGATQLQPRQRNEDDDESLGDQWSTQSVLSDDSSWPGSGSCSAFLLCY